MELEQKRIHYLQAGKTITDQFVLDEDYNVPDAKEDVRKLLKGKAELKAEDMRMAENYLCVSGKLYFHILYTPIGLEPTLAVLEGSFPFEEMIYTGGGDVSSFFLEKSHVEFTPELVHSRKIGLRAVADLEIGQEETVDAEIPLGIPEEPGIFCKYQKRNLLQMTLMKKDTCRIKEEFTIPGTKEGIGEILQSDIAARKTEIRMGQDELLIRGELQVFCLYLSAEQKTDWVEQTVPYEGRVECDGAEEGMYHQVHCVLSDALLDVRMDEDGEMRVLGVEATLSLRIHLFEEKETELLEDVYGQEKRCLLDTKEMVCEELLIQNQSRQKITERLALPELKEDVLQICHSEGSLQTEQVKIREDGIGVEGILHLTFLYIKADDDRPFAAWQGMVPFSHVLECPGICPEARCQIETYLEQLQVTLSGSQNLEVKAVLAFDAFVRKPVAMELITGVTFEPVTEEEWEKMPGIVGYIVKEGDTLWSLAKKYMTSEASIRLVNQIEKDVLSPGEKLLIMRENVQI